MARQLHLFAGMSKTTYGSFSKPLLAFICLVSACSPRVTAPAEEPDPGPNSSPSRFNPFELYPAGVGAIHYDDMADAPTPELPKGWEETGVSAEAYRAAMNEEKEGVERIDAWAQVHHSPAVTAKWSRYTRQKHAEAQSRRAAYEAALEGTGDVGVE